MANNMTTDKGVSDHVEYLCDTDVPIFTSIFIILIFIISVLGNGLVLFIYNRRSSRDIFILNLACSDLIFTFTLPFWAVYYLHHWVFGDFLCKFMTAAYFVGLYSSVILLTAMTVHRFINVVLTVRFNRWFVRRYTIGCCIAAWVISISASLSDAIKAKVQQWDDVNYCEGGSDDELGYYLQISLLFFLPLAIIIFCQSVILKKILQIRHHTTINYRTAAMLLCIVAAFFICWGPYHILLLIKFLYTPKGCKAQQQLNIAFHICEILAYSHCCMNPLLYMFSQQFQKHLFKLLCCENKCRKNRERGTGQNVLVIQRVAFTAHSSAVKLHSDLPICL